MGALTRVEQQVAARRKANALDKLTDIGPPPDNWHEMLEDAQIGHQMVENEVWNNDYNDWIGRPSKPVEMIAKNVASVVAGGTIGAVNALYDLYEYGAKQPGGVSDKPLPPNEDTIWEAFTDENIARSLGGNPDHWSFLAASFMAPSVGEKGIGSLLRGDALQSVRKVISGGPIGAKNAKAAGREILTLQEAMQKGKFEKPYDARDVKETGWYKTDKDEYHFLISDKDAKIDVVAEVTKDPHIKNLQIGQHRQITVRLEDVMDFPELYDTYPQLRQMPLHLSIRRTPEGYDIFHPLDSPNSRGAMYTWEPSGPMAARPRVGGIAMHTAEDMVQFKGTLMHEIQHVIQTIEGFARGGESAFTRTLDTSLKALRHNMAVQQALKHLEKILPQDLVVSREKAQIAQHLSAWGFSRDEIADVINGSKYRGMRKQMYNVKADPADTMSQSLIDSGNLHIAAEIEAAAGKWGFVLDAMKNGSWESASYTDMANVLISRLNSMGEPGSLGYDAMINKLVYEGYLGLRGERTARRAGQTIDDPIEKFWDQHQMDTLDPRRAPEFDVEFGDPAAARGEAKRVRGTVPGENASRTTPGEVLAGLETEAGIDVEGNVAAGPIFNPGHNEYMDLEGQTIQKFDDQIEAWIKEGRIRPIAKVHQQPVQPREGMATPPVEYQVGQLSPTSARRITELDVSNVFQMQGNDKMIPVMINPTGPTEIGRFLGKHVKGATALRYLKTKQDGWIIWDADDALHADVAARLGFPEYDIDPDILAYGDIGLDELPGAYAIDDYFAMLDEDIAKGMVR